MTSHNQHEFLQLFHTNITIHTFHHYFELIFSCSFFFLRRHLGHYITPKSSKLFHFPSILNNIICVCVCVFQYIYIYIYRGKHNFLALSPAISLSIFLLFSSHIFHSLFDYININKENIWICFKYIKQPKVALFSIVSQYLLNT